MIWRQPALVLASALSIGVLHAASITPLGWAPGEVGSFGLYVSPDGRTVIGRGLGSGAAFRWRDGVLTGAESGSVPTCYSENGDVVAGRNGNQAFLWTNGPVRYLGSLPGRSRHWPYAISADGTVVAGSATGGGSQPFVWRATTGVMQALPTLPGSGGFSYVYAISKDGRIIGGESSGEAVVWEEGVLRKLNASGSVRLISDDGTFVVRVPGNVPFRLKDGVVSSLGDLPGGSVNSIANAISADGSTVVGGSKAAPGLEAFRWKDGILLGLGELAGGDYSGQGLAVSGDGSIVVGVSSVSDFNSQAFIWTLSRGMQSLEDRLQSLGVDLTGWSRLRSAEHITPNGRFICGHGVRKGELEAYLVDLGVPAIPVPVIAPSADGLTVRMRFTGEAGRGYRLQRATTLGGAWGVDQVLSAGSGQSYEVELVADGDGGYFRVLAE